MQQTSSFMWIKSYRSEGDTVLLSTVCLAQSILGHIKLTSLHSGPYNQQYFRPF